MKPIGNLIRKIHKMNPAGISVLKSADSIVQTQPVSSLSDFFSQRLRWSCKLKRAGSPGLMFTSALVWLCKASLIASPILALVYGSREFLLVSLVLIAFHLILDFAMLWEACRFFSRRKLLWYFLPMELIYFLYLLLLGIMSWLPVSLEWKDRKIQA